MAKKSTKSESQENILWKTPIVRRFMDVTQDIRQSETPERYEQALVAKQLVQVTLPHAEPPADLRVWSRTNGELTLTVRPGWDAAQNRSLGYPYGILPRLLLFWMTTEVAFTESRRLYLGDSLAGFMDELELDSRRGGVRSDATRLREQMERLFRAVISFEYCSPTGPGAEIPETKRWFDMQIAPHGELWWDAPAEQALGWKSWIELGEKFYEALRSAPVPIDTRAIRALKNSALALDLYAWLAYKLYVAAQDAEPIFVDWKGLNAQFGAEYNDSKNFVKKAKDVLLRIQMLYPDLKLEFPYGGLRLYPAQGLPFIAGETPD